RASASVAGGPSPRRRGGQGRPPEHVPHPRARQPLGDQQYGGLDRAARRLDRRSRRVHAQPGAQGFGGRCQRREPMGRERPGGGQPHAVPEGDELLVPRREYPGEAEGLHAVRERGGPVPEDLRRCRGQRLRRLQFHSVAMITDPAGVAIVTGGSRGIGAAVVRALAAAGYTVVFSYRAAADEAASVVSAVRDDNRRAVAVRAGAAVPADLDALFRTVDGIAAPLRVLVNNAAVRGPLSRFAEVGAETLRQIIDVNLIGAMLCTQHAIARMSTRSGGAGGSIINVSS